MKVTRVIHRMWKEWQKIPDELKTTPLMKTPIIGKYQYLYENKKAKISLIKLNYNLNWFKGGWVNYSWEICGGGLTDNREKFRTKKDAEIRIEELLREKIR